MSTVVVFGADDVECRTSVQIAQAAGATVGFATRSGVPVSKSAAYCADGIKWQGKKAKNVERLILFECGFENYNILPVSSFLLADHHRPGDPGYDVGPDQYLRGSSLGQLAMLLRVDGMISREQKFVAASDHCLGALYRGMCVDFSRDDVINLRLPNRKPRDFIARVARSLEDIELDEYGLRDLSHFVKRGNLPVLTMEAFQYGGMGIKFSAAVPDGIANSVWNASPETVKLFVESHLRGGRVVRHYGCPARGYAKVVTGL